MNTQFTDLYNTIINEGMINIPRDEMLNNNMLKDIEQHVISVFSMIKSKDIIEAKPFTIPNKIFKLNFAGTKWEFLNAINPKVEIIFLNNNENHSFLYSPEEYPVKITKSKDDMKTGKGYIIFSIDRSLDSILKSGIGHEITHFIQYGLVTWKIKTGKLPDMRIEEFPQYVGGLPPKRLIPKDISNQGFRMNKDEVEKVDSHKRPIEALPKLLDIVRAIQYMYYKVDMNNTGTTKDKKEYLANIINDVPTLQKLKRDNIKMYEHFLKNIYDQFVNKNWFTDTIFLNKLIEDGNAKVQAEIIKRARRASSGSDIPFNLVEDDFIAKTLKVNTRDDIMFDLDMDEFGESSIVYIEDIFDKIGLKNKYYRVLDQEFFSIPMNYKALHNLFINLSELLAKKVHEKDYDVSQRDTWYKDKNGKPMTDFHLLRDFTIEFFIYIRNYLKENSLTKKELPIILLSKWLSDGGLPEAETDAIANYKPEYQREFNNNKLEYRNLGDDDFLRGFGGMF